MPCASTLRDRPPRARSILRRSTPRLISAHLYTRDYPDPDLLIRTSGEMRLSNFLLWQLSYTEIYVTQKLWPDFGKADLRDAIAEFHRRSRRFGRVA